ncbi:UvrD-helicase domain-containing protein, partial [Micromonospora sp. D75]
MGVHSGAERVLAGLDPEQRSAVTAPAGPVCILAGAGTGKTRAVTSRIAYRALTGDIAGRHVLAVTFTARAAAEMRSRLTVLGVQG